METVSTPSSPCDAVDDVAPVDSLVDLDAQPLDAVSSSPSPHTVSSSSTSRIPINEVSVSRSPLNTVAAVDSLVDLHVQPLDARSPAPSPRVSVNAVDVVTPVAKRKGRKRKLRPEDAMPLLFSITAPPKKLTKIEQRAFAVQYPVEFTAWQRAKTAAWWRRHEKKQREQRIARWLRTGAELPDSMTREKTLFVPAVIRPEPAIARKVERSFVKTYKTECWCGACSRVRYERPQVHDDYVCRMGGCRHTFRDIAAFLTHQIDVHATVNVHCRRTREEFYRTQAAMLFPPETVYIVFQYMHGTTLPTMWTMAEVDQEKDMLEIRIAALRKHSTLRSVPKRFMKASFEVAYERIQRYGISELKHQFSIALEHYESALAFPNGPRHRHDGISTVRVGRNWLLSPEPENAERSRVIIEAKTLEADCREESEDEEEETVLFQYGVETERGEVSVRKPETSAQQENNLEMTEPVKKFEPHTAIGEPQVLCL